MQLHNMIAHCHRLTVFGQIILESPDGSRFFRSAFPKEPFELVGWTYHHGGYIDRFPSDEIPEGVYYYKDGSGRTLDFKDEGWKLSQGDREELSYVLRDLENAVQCLKDEELL